jgi:deoxycytidylate deaminase
MLFEDPFTAMQAAVDIVQDSPHPVSKVAAALFGKNFGIARTNFWPDPILKHFGKDTDIGNSSGTVHAETACILSADAATEGASLAVTDPFCPNCAKNIAEAGIKKIYIDHKGFDKDFFKRRSGHFQTMSMQICEKAGISVYELWRKDERLVPIHEAPSPFFVSEDSPVYKEPIERAGDAVFTDVLTQAFRIHQKRKFAVALAVDKKGGYFALTGRGHAVTGFTMEDPEDIAVIERTQDKYSLFQEPVNRMLMYARRHDFKICDGYFFCSQVPTSREQVNLVGAGITRITIGDLKKARDPDALVAMKQLSDAGIINYT